MLVKAKTEFVLPMLVPKPCISRRLYELAAGKRELLDQCRLVLAFAASKMLTKGSLLLKIQ